MTTSKQAYRVKCTYEIIGITGQEYPRGESQEPEIYWQEDYSNRLHIEKSYDIQDAVTLTRALMIIDNLDNAVQESLPK